MRPIEDIISEKAYSELSEQELLEVAELAANEEEYNQMKRFFESFATEVQTGYGFQASPAVKESLDNIFMAKHPVIAQDWNKEEVTQSAPIIPFYKRRFVQIAAILLLCLGAAPLLFKQDNTAFDLKEKQGNTLAKQGTVHNSSQDSYSSGHLSTPSDLPEGIVTNDKHNALTANAKTIWVGKLEAPADDSDLKEGNLSLAGIAPTFSLSEGLRADLDPTFGTAVNSSTTDKTKHVTSVASGSEMLDWIQAAY